ncbi:formate dehydrogenase accessory sulfurtransferase FdhD [Oleidesulfovibrio sp.]|uniref:formate dehydrogenase accessory sulfurtransferase FdhD n=1 Tax=Oleidesulfovibrio sp. TaxID=2909707 RepID=UPI003A86177F
MHTKHRRITRLNPDGSMFSDDDIIIESPLEIVVNGVAWAALMRTPGDDEALTLGYCHTEGLLRRGEAYQLCRTELPDGTTRMLLTIEGGKERTEKMMRGRGVRMGFSCCGNRNAVSADELIRPMKPVPMPVSIPAPASGSVQDQSAAPAPQSISGRIAAQNQLTAGTPCNRNTLPVADRLTKKAETISMSESSLQPASRPCQRAGGKLGHGPRRYSTMSFTLPVPGGPAEIRLKRGNNAQQDASATWSASCSSAPTGDISETGAGGHHTDIAGYAAESADDFSIPPQKLNALLREAEGYQALFSRTGGTHFCALYDADLNMLAFAEDTGRHNALDKAAGQAVMQNAADKIRLVLLSSRLSFEMVQKSLALRARVVAGISAVTSKGVELADASGITLVGFLRNGRMNIYTHERRMISTQHSPCHTAAAGKPYSIG